MKNAYIIAKCSQQGIDDMNFRLIFQYISYLQYPLMLIAAYFVVLPYLSGLESLKKDPSLLLTHFNSALIFLGLGISFSSLQDTSKTQNKFSLRIWQDAKKGKLALIVLSVMILVYLIIGLTGYFMASQSLLKDVSVGMIVLSLGMFGLLKSAMEMFEHHRTDKNLPAQTTLPTDAV